jgi:predicted acetyltransferase
MVELVPPDKKYSDSFLEALTEEGRDLVDVETYVLHMKDAARGENLSKGEVARHEYWLVDKSRYLGKIQIRHEPKGRVPEIASHVYYEIRRSMRGKGYGNLILKEGLKKAKELGFPELVVSVDENNLASITVIEHNGGVFQKTVFVEDSETPVRIYTVKL